MKPRMEFWKVAPGAYKAMASLEAYLHGSGLEELADLTWAVAAINAWNRVSIALRAEAGSYRPAVHA